MRYVYSFIAFALILALTIQGELTHAEPADDVNSTSSADSDSAVAITILLPDLEKQASSVDSSANFKDLYRMVTVARGYQQLGLYQEAGEWYERLSDLDQEELFSDAVFHGQLSVAAGQGKVETLHELLDNQAGGVENVDPQVLEDIFQQVAISGDWKQVSSLIAGTRELLGDKPPAGIMLLEGRALRRQGLLMESVFHFERMLNQMKVASSVHPSLLEQRARILQAAADCSFLMNDRLRARQLYGELLADEDPVFCAWGRFQLAQLDMLANDYSGAEQGFRAVAADSLGLRIEDWSLELISHCRVMQRHTRYYVDTGPQSMAAVP